MKANVFNTCMALVMLFCPRAEAVINGQFLHGEEFHWVVRVTTTEGTCSGSLVAADWVLTAGHCLGEQLVVQIVDYPSYFDFERYQDMDALMNDYQGQYHPETAGDFLISQREVQKVHYRAGTDVALLKLKSPFDKVNNFPPVATSEEVQSLADKHYIELAVAGFGLNGRLGQPVSEALFGMFKYYYLTAIDRNALPIPFSVTPGNVYETPRGFRPSLNDPEPGPGVAQAAIGSPGDSGGPLLAFIEGQWRIIGVNIQAGGSLRWIKFVLLGGNLEMPGRFRHLKVNNRTLCNLVYLTGGDSGPAELQCQ